MIRTYVKISEQIPSKGIIIATRKELVTHVDERRGYEKWMMHSIVWNRIMHMVWLMLTETKTLIIGERRKKFSIGKYSRYYKLRFSSSCDNCVQD